MGFYAHCPFLRNSCCALSHPLIPPYYPTLPMYIHYRAHHSLPHQSTLLSHPTYPTFLSHPTISHPLIPPSYPTLPISTIVLATLPTPTIPPSYPTPLSHLTIPPYYPTLYETFRTTYCTLFFCHAIPLSIHSYF